MIGSRPPHHLFLLAPFWLNIRKANVKNAHLQEINQLVTGFDYLDPKYKNGAIHYLEECFELAGHHQPFIHFLQKTCR